MPPKHRRGPPPQAEIDAVIAAAGAGPVSAGYVAASTGLPLNTCAWALKKAGWIKYRTKHEKLWRSPDSHVSPQPRARRKRSLVRVAIPDSHGAHIDPTARDAFLSDLKRLAPDEIVMLGDHLDCAGTFSAHQRSYTNEMAETYEEDVAAANHFLDAIQAAAPAATIYYLEGNHEQHVERWAAREFANKADADKVLEAIGPEALLRLRQRGIRYFRRAFHYMDISIPGTIRLGKVFFTHGIAHSTNAARTHVQRFSANVVFGHVHASQSVVERTVSSDAQGAWCPGTLAKLQPLYRHTAPSNWTHGYGVEFVGASGNFVHVNIPIYRGESSLPLLAHKF